MDKNWIHGRCMEGEQAKFCETFVTKLCSRESGCRAKKECVLTWRDLAFRMNVRRFFALRSQKSADVVLASFFGEGPGIETDSPLFTGGDDCNVYVNTLHAGERVMAGVAGCAVI